MNIGAVILAGGKSRRMGRDKAELSFDGQSFLERTAGELSCFEELLLSAGHERQYTLSLPVVADIFEACGPMGGLHGALRACRSDALFAVSCDMPLFKQALALFLCSKMTEDFDALVAVSRDGRVHPLCGVYKKSAADVFEAQLAAGSFRLLQALEQMRVLYVPLDSGGFADDILTNVNTPLEYASLNGNCTSAKSIKNFMLTGPRGIGKSTIIQKTLAELDVPFGGFYTRFDTQKNLYMCGAEQAPTFCQENLVAAFDGEKMLGLPEKFDKLGCDFLGERGNGAKIIVMDELGGLEKNAEVFQRAVKGCLDDKLPVLGVIRRGFPAWTAEIAARADLCVIEVSEKNRDELPKILAAKIISCRERS